MTTTLPTLINGRWTINLLPHRAGMELWKTGWETIRVNSLHANLEPGDLIYDIGSEEGDFPALWRSWGCDVVMFEPGPEVWANIRATWEANNAEPPRAAFHGFAASDDYLPVGEPVQTTLWPSTSAGETITNHGFSVVNQRPDVARMKVDTMAERVGAPDALAIDVEGAEFQVLQGAARVLTTTRPLMWISVHPDQKFHTFANSARDMFALLREHGYKWTPLSYDHELHVLCWHPANPPKVVP